MSDAFDGDMYWRQYDDGSHEFWFELGNGTFKYVDIFESEKRLRKLVHLASRSKERRRLRAKRLEFVSNALASIVVVCLLLLALLVACNMLIDWHHSHYGLVEQLAKPALPPGP